MCLGLLALAGCGVGKDSNREAFLAACVAGGDTDAFCACQADSLQAALDEDSFAALVEFAAGMADASEEARGMMAMGALSNPRLVAALDQAETAGKACTRAAALEEVRAEVLAAEAVRDARRKQAAARKCPHVPAMSPRVPDAPVDDLADLRPGMSFADVEAILECRGDVVNFDVAREWARQSPDIETRQLLRVADGDICPAAARLAGGKGCDDAGWGFAALQDVRQEFIVGFTGLPEAERAGVIWRRTVFAAGEYPTMKALQDALMEKYGRPNVSANTENYYSLGHRRGTVVYSWVYTPAGQLISSDDGTAKSRCVNGPRPTFAQSRQMSWNGGCGLTIRAEMVAAADNSALARELNVIVMDQKRFNDAVAQFDIDLRAATEALHAGKGAQPDL